MEVVIKNSEAETVSYLTSGVDPHVLQAVVRLAEQLARQGREGKRVGALFVVGDESQVLRRSRPLILDPLAGHSDEAKSVLDPHVRGTLRELALLDGAFVVSAKGIVLSAARCLDVQTEGIRVPLGLGSRHRAAASITYATEALAVVVSQSSSIRLFHRGEVVDELEVRAQPLEDRQQSGERHRHRRPAPPTCPQARRPLHVIRKDVR